MAQARKIWAKEKKMWGQTTLDREKLKQARNAYYRIVRKAKRECWQNFLEGTEESSNPAQIRPKNKNRCWIALKYTKPKSNSTTPALIGLNKEIAVIMQDKEALVRVHAFLPSPVFYKTKYKPKQGIAHLLVTKDSVAKLFYASLLKKHRGLTCTILGSFVYCGTGNQIILPQWLHKLLDCIIIHNGGDMQKEFF